MGLWLEAEIETIKNFKYFSSPVDILYDYCKSYNIPRDELIIKQSGRGGVINFSLQNPDCYTNQIHSLFEFLVKNKTKTGIFIITINRNYYA